MDEDDGVQFFFSTFKLSSGVGATEITYIGEWDFTQYRRNAQFLMKI